VTKTSIPRGAWTIAAGTVAGLLALAAAAPSAGADPTGGDAATAPDGDESDESDDEAEGDEDPSDTPGAAGGDGPEPAEEPGDGAEAPRDPARDDAPDEDGADDDLGDPPGDAASPDPTRPADATVPEVPVIDGEPIDFRGTAANSPGNRILRRIAWIAQGGEDHRYRHRTKIRRAQGLYWWDCSGMASWLLEKEAPVALRGLFAERPTAERFHDTIADAPVDRSRRGWQRIPRIQDLMPGDLFAWRLPPDRESVNTGHVGFVVRPPVPLPAVGEGAWAVRIADSTSEPHGNDPRVEDRRTGFGFGTILIVVDDDGAPIAYGWRGVQSTEVVETDIVFGRVTR